MDVCEEEKKEEPTTDTKLEVLETEDKSEAAPSEVKQESVAQAKPEDKLKRKVCCSESFLSLFIFKEN